MNSTDWSHLIVASNDAAMQWYSLVTQKAMPSQPDLISSPLPFGGGVRLGTQTGTLVLIGAALLVVFLIFKK